MSNRLILLFLCGILIQGRSVLSLTPDQSIQDNGYPSETHYITTEDGYILTYYRIPHGLNNTEEQRPVALLVHGLSSSAGDFIKLGPSRSLAYILADRGYDVWMANVRGNPYSRNHTTLNPSVDYAQFFNFTWHEMGFYDIANGIDYILDVTKEEKLFFVGHSQGTTAFLALASARPEYNDKLRLASLMAPVGIIKNIPNFILRSVSQYVYEVSPFVEKYSIYEFPPGMASKDILHYGQLVKNGQFSYYDYGPEGNLEMYMSEEVPQYDLSKISTPLALYYCKNDTFVAVEDEHTLEGLLPNVISNYLVEQVPFFHGDFVKADNIVELVYNELLSVMEQY